MQPVSSSQVTSDKRKGASSDFRRMMKLIGAAGIVMTAGALWYLSLFGPLTVHMVVATIAGVFFSVLLGCGLFAAAFFSDKSGHDEQVTNATRAAQPPLTANPEALPAGLTSYRRTADFTEASVPPALLADHDTKPGTWGLIHVTEGQLCYRVTDPRRPETETLLSPDQAPGIVEPTILHRVEPIGTVTFHVEFFRTPTNQD